MKTEVRRQKSVFLLLFLCLGLVAYGLKPALANNITVENVSLVDKDTGANTIDIQFDIAWDNSWYISGAPSATANWDAAWVFAKYSVYNAGTGTWGDWTHCTLLNTGNVAPADSQMSFGATDSVYKGVFIYRSLADSGSVDWNDAEIRWNYPAGVADDAMVKVKVFCIEMVLIPGYNAGQGWSGFNFYVGDKDNDNTNCFLTSDGSYVKDKALPEYQITSEGAITVGTANGNLYYDADNIYSGDQSGPIPAAFPKGYNAFYIMKYEISQGQYKDFLNTLTRTQQNSCTASQTANYFAMSGNTAVINRSVIRNPASIPSGVITFGCDYDGGGTLDGIFNESNDGEWIACNYLKWADVIAYADWAALRPFTELEFEKAARGGQTAVDDEYAWGTAYIPLSGAYTLGNSGATNEGIATNYSTTPDYGNCSYSVTDGSIDGPLRCGIFAAHLSNTGRITSGGSYYGVMELSGNLWERPVTIGNSAGRDSFTGTHGDGDLATVPSGWPSGSTASGSGSRGGRWGSDAADARVSGRNYAAFASTDRSNGNGGRCARTSP